MPKQKGRGRPRNDPSTTARAEILAFEALTSETVSSDYRKFLGDEHKTKLRQLKELERSLGAAMNEASEVEVFDLLTVGKKTVEVEC